MENAQVADILEEIAALLELDEANQFRVRSYRNAARTIRGLSSRLEDMVKAGEDLDDLSNVGESTAKKIREILDRGTCDRLEELRKKLPNGLVNVMDVPGMGPKKSRKVYRELDVESLDDLRQAVEKHKVRDLKGMGPKTEEKIARGLGMLKKTSGRILLHDADSQVESLGRHLDDISAIARWQVAGSYRRSKETVGDLDVLIQADDRVKATEAILDHDAIDHVDSRGTEKITVHLSGGLQVDFRFFEPEAFGAALVYFTGSKAHNIHLRRIAQNRNWKLSEYGLFNGDRRLAGKDEESVYSRLNLAWIPPELREDRGEIEAADEGELPELIELEDVRGDLQSHTTASDGQDSIEDMAKAARKRGYSFFAITDHSKRVTMANGLDEDRIRKHADSIRKVNDDMKNMWLMAGVEVDVLKDGSLDLAEKVLASLDWVVASIHYDRSLSKQRMTDRYLSAIHSGGVHALGHPLGRIIGRREPIGLDLDKIFSACVENNVALEINAQPDRLDLPDHHVKAAAEAGVTFTLGTDAHKTAELAFMPQAVRVARRGWLRADQVLNTLTATKLRKAIRKG